MVSCRRDASIPSPYILLLFVMYVVVVVVVVVCESSGYLSSRYASLRVCICVGCQCHHQIRLTWLI